MSRSSARCVGSLRFAMRGQPSPLTVVAFLVAAALVAESAVSCSLPDDSARIALAVRARRNSSGHWIVKVDAKGDAGDRQELQLDVETELRAPLRRSGAVHLTSTTELAVETARVAAPSGYENLGGGGSLYKLYTHGATWDDAAFRCLQDGAHLIVLDTESEAIIVRKLFATKANITGAELTDHWHAGFHNRYNISKTITVLGNPMPERALVQIEAGEKYPDQRCGRVKYTGAHVRGPCDGSRAFVCEFEQNPL